MADESTLTSTATTSVESGIDAGASALSGEPTRKQGGVGTAVKRTRVKKNGGAKQVGASSKITGGKITGVKAAGKTYLTLSFTTGQIKLTPTSNRAANRDLAVKAINALIG